MRKLLLEIEKKESEEIKSIKSRWTRGLTVILVGEIYLPGNWPFMFENTGRLR